MKVLELLRRYTGKSKVHLTQRGNKSILLALKIAKSLGFNKVIIPDQGGWIVYLQYPDRLKFKTVELKTDYGIIDPNVLSKELDEKSVVLVNSLAGYFAEQPTGLLYAMCKQKNAFFINDASGSIGTEEATYGDIIIGSFGYHKPVNLEYGGFIAFNELDFDKSILEGADFDKHRIPALEKKLQNLPARLRMYRKHHDKIKQDLAELNIIHKDKHGINVIVKFKDNFEKERIIKYCEKNNYEYTECPRYIRVNTEAISIEVKRL